MNPSPTNSSPDPFSWKEKGPCLGFPLSCKERGTGGEFGNGGLQFTANGRHRLVLHRVALLAVLLPLRIALAHSFAPAVLDLREFQNGRFDVLWKLPGPESGSLAGGVDTPRPHVPARCRDIDGLSAANVAEDGPSHWRVDCGPEALRGESVWVSGLDGTRLDVIVRITWSDGTSASAVLRSGDEHFQVPAHRVSANGAPVGTVLWSYGRLGVAHILLGADHLLFVLGLLLLVESWGMLVKTISAFTVAHSLALALAVLGFVHVPPAPVEALIACSIILVALELTRDQDAPRSLTHAYPWLVAFAFGLLHGLGFAGALAEIGLPADQVALALVAFNGGVEIGQLAFVIAMTGPLAVLARITAAWPRTRLIPAYAIGALATAWALERIQGFWRS